MGLPATVTMLSVHLVRGLPAFPPPVRGFYLRTFLITHLPKFDKNLFITYNHKTSYIRAETRGVFQSGCILEYLVENRKNGKLFPNLRNMRGNANFKVKSVCHFLP